jgi:hypothetical protein
VLCNHDNQIAKFCTALPGNLLAWRQYKWESQCVHNASPENGDPILAASRTASQDADTSMAVRSIANVLSTVLTWLTRFVTPVAEALFSDDSLRRRGYLLALVGLAGWGLVTLALWILGVIEPDPRVLGLSAVAVLPLLVYSYVKNKLLGSILSIVFLLLLVGAILLWARPDSWIAKLLGTG